MCDQPRIVQIKDTTSKIYCVWCKIMAQCCRCSVDFFFPFFLFWPQWFKYPDLKFSHTGPQNKGSVLVFGVLVLMVNFSWFYHLFKSHVSSTFLFKLATYLLPSRNVIYPDFSSLSDITRFYFKTNLKLLKK